MSDDDELEALEEELAVLGERPRRRCLAGDGLCQADAFYVPTTTEGMQWFACEEHAAGPNVCGDMPRWLFLISDFWALIEARERRAREAYRRAVLAAEDAVPDLRRLRVALSGIRDMDWTLAPDEREF